MNSTLLVLIPKAAGTLTIQNYRPISLCTTLYKILAKLLAKRLQSILPDIIHPAQAAFLKGRSLEDNILLAHELLRGFHLPTHRKAMCLKVDLQKAFDSVSRKALLQILEIRGFPPSWISERVSGNPTFPLFNMVR